MILATTTVTITRQETVSDPYEEATVSTVATAVAAHLSAPSGDDARVGGDKEVVTATCYLPAGTDVDTMDVITDDTTSIAHQVAWVRARRGLGLDHVVAGLRAVRGGADG